MIKLGIAILIILCTLGALRGLVAIGETVPMIEPTGNAVKEGNLTRQPIRFAQTDFWFYPPTVDAELGTLTVPALHDDTSGPSLDLRYVRFASENPEKPGSPVVYLAGGPGGMGVYSASGDRFGLFMKLREAGDVIAFDQRGTRSSNPSPRCPETDGLPLDQPSSKAAMIAAYQPVLETCHAKLGNTLHPDSFSTAESVEDLEQLRRALGSEKLNFVGISYGTHLALAYMKRYPSRVDKAVLAGVEGLDHTWKRPAVVDGIVRAISHTLETEAGWSGFEQDIERAIERLTTEQPVITTTRWRSDESVDVKLGPDDLKLAVLYGLGEREDFKRAAKRVRNIAEGDYEELARYALRLRAGGEYLVMPISMDCASGASTERRRLIEQEKQHALIGDVANLDLETMCPYWPVTDLGAEFRENFESSLPVLAISGTLDSRTPPSNAIEALAGFSNWHHLLIEGGGHSDDLLIASSDIGQAMVNFFSTGQPGIDRIEMSGL